MKSVRQCLCKCVLALSVFSSCVSSASASPDIRKAAILLAMTEAALSSVSLLHDHTHKDLKNFNWTSTFSDRDFVYKGEGYFDDNTGGVKFSFTMTGYLWGDDGQDLSLTYSGNGYANDEPVRLNGRSDWAYDKDQSDYMKMDFRHVMKFGNNSTWGWIVGSEIVTGGLIVAATVELAPVTGGLSLAAAYFLGTMGAITAKDAIVAISNSVESMIESHDPVSQPEQPVRPTPPIKGGPIKLNPDQILTSISKDGRLSGYGLNKLILAGRYDGKGGNAQGTISASQPDKRLDLNKVVWLDSASRNDIFNMDVSDGWIKTHIQ